MKIAMLVLLVITLACYVGGRAMGGPRADMNELPLYVGALLAGSALIVVCIIWVVIQIVKS